MKLRVIVAILILAVVVAGGIAALVFTDGFYGELLSLLEQAKPGGQPGFEALEQAYRLWIGNQLIICVLVGDAHADTITFAFARALTFSREGDTGPEYLSAISDLISGIRHLREFDRPTIQAIF